MRSKNATLKISTTERILFAKRIALYLRSGIPLLEALYLIESDIGKGTHSKILSGVIERVREGIPVSRALVEYPRAYQKFHVQIIAVGEASGTLADAFAHLADVLARRLRLSRSIISALAYPLIILLGTLSISGFLIFYAFPKIVPLFKGLHAQLPFTTRSLIWISEIASTHGWFFLLSFIVLVLIVWFSLQRGIVRKEIDSILLYTPLIGECIRFASLSTLFRIIAVLLKSGVRLGEAILLASESIGNTNYKKSVLEMERAVLSGMKATSVMEHYPLLYPSLAIQLMAAGEMTGTLSESARTVANIYEDALEERLRMLATLLEPILMIVMGVIVGFVALAIITPMYSLTQNLSQ